MPIYEYRCASCRNVFEEWTKQAADFESEAPCPSCGGKGKRLISNTSFALKGGGWYATEYGGSKAASSSGKEPATCSADSPAKTPAPCAGGCASGGCAAKSAE